MHQSAPAGSVTAKSTPKISTADELAAEAALAKRTKETFAIASANQSLAMSALFKPQQSKYAMQNLLQAHYLPEQESADLAKFASPSDQTKLSMYKNLGQPQSRGPAILDLLKI
jgi:hypothetical protein